MTSRLRLSGRATLAVLLLWTPLAANAADNWIEVRSPHFTVNTNAGEREARKIAGQFEQIRQMFHSAFSTFRVDPAQPIIIVAAKNENTMKLFLPEEWEVKGHIHHAGMYQQGEDKDYVVLRLDTEGENPYHTLYHEYTHALLRLNFSNLPVWLNEGLADFFGNSTLGDKEVKTGTIDSGHLYLLNQSKLIPIETLLEVGHDSPFYNETNRASVFYAESWAVVHFLMMHPEARQKQLLKNFLAAWEKSGDQVEAAREAFGDLKQFGKRIESYSRQASFQIGLVKVEQGASGKDYPSRSLSAGETLALRGDFFGHHNRLDQAQPVLEEAVKMEPNLAVAHEALGYWHYRRHESEEADKEMTEAMRLGATDFVAPYFHGVLLLQGGSFDEDAAKDSATSLEKAVLVNPQFAPAYEWLSRAYSRSPETQKQAVTAAIKAVQLDPATLTYSINLAHLLVYSNRLPKARIVAKRILASAGTPAEKVMANQLLANLDQAEESAANKPSNSTTLTVQSDAHSTDSTTGAKPANTPQPAISQDVPIHLKYRVLAADGVMSSVQCSEKPELMISVDLPSGPVSFHAADIAKISLSSAAGTPEPTINKCAQWKGRQVKVWFSPTPGKDYAGEITKLHFF
jgi:tetratricopeptide (TPR) repeat protein